MAQRSGLNVHMKSFQDEQNEALEYFLNTIYKVWQKPWSEQTRLRKDEPKKHEELFLELFLTQECNQACSYCYLQKNGEKLYPVEIRDKKQLIKNISILLDYYTENKIFPHRIDLFSGEIWGYPLGNQVFDVLLDALKKGFKTKAICIPSNISFCRDENLIKAIDYYIDRFSDYGVELGFSASIDGPYLDSLNRPCQPNSHNFKDDNFIDNALSFCKRHKFGHHPMISARNIDLQKDNYKAWIQKFHELYPNLEDFREKYNPIMQLEVRGDDWTTENILKYLDWLNFVIDTDIKEFFNDDPLYFLDDMFHLHNYPIFGRKNRSYRPYTLSTSQIDATCTAGKMLCIRCGDLSFVPCHRTSYEKFLFGNYVVENDKIVGVNAKNISLMNAWYRTGFDKKPKCDTCVLSNFCVRGCMGSQFENTGELFYPDPKTCNFFMAKITFLILKYEKLGLFEYKPFLEKKSPLLPYIENFKKTEEFNTWKTLTQSLL